jgi:hypothetical protein
MKFGVEWNTQISILPEKLSKKSISYKKWKNISKNISIINQNEIFIQLHIDCNIVNKTFIKYNKIIENKNILCSLFNIFYKSDVSISTKDLYKYALLNKKTLYKICKRLDKRTNSDIFKTWLNTNYINYSFNGGIYLTKLKLEHSDDIDKSCPICLEDEVKSIIILKCGHIICYDCIKLIYNSKNKDNYIHTIARKDVINKPAYCPVCRFEISFLDITNLKLI